MKEINTPNSDIVTSVVLSIFMRFMVFFWASTFLLLLPSAYIFGLFFYDDPSKFAFDKVFEAIESPASGVGGFAAIIVIYSLLQSKKDRKWRLAIIGEKHDQHP